MSNGLQHAALMEHLKDQYLIESELGRGGMGVVYLARDKRLDRPVAIKVLNLAKSGNQALSDELIERFQREARVVARMSHPSLVTLYDVGQVDDFYYMIMEYAPGKALSEIVEAGQKLPPALVASIGQQVAQALALAHEQGIIHRDIKPGNIILSNKGITKLTDFGIAQLSQQEEGKLTQAGTMMGSIMYASPEQIQDASQVDIRTDIYSLGVTLFELLTAASPYQGTQLSQIILEIMSQQDSPVNIRRLAPETPEALEILIQRAMSKNPDDRFANAQEMAQQFGLLLNSSLISSQPLQFQIDTNPSATGASRRPGSATQLKRTTLNIDLLTALRHKSNWVTQVVSSWKQESLTQLSLTQVLEKVMETNLLGKALTGCLIVEERYYLFLANGHFVGAADIESNQHGEAVFASLPAKSIRLELRTVPEGHELAPLILANILEEKGKVLQSRLDSSLMDLNPLLESFSAAGDALTGFVVCMTEGSVYFYGFDRGQVLFSAAVGDKPLDNDTWLGLAQLVKHESLIMNVFGLEPSLMGPSLNQCLKNAHIEVSYQNPDQTSLQDLANRNDELPIYLIREAKDNLRIQLKQDRKPEMRVGDHLFDLAPIFENLQHYKVAQWLIKEYFFLLNSSDNTTSLKYIYSWLPAVQRFDFSQDLAGADGQQHSFSLVARGVVFGEDYEKVLFVIRLGNGDSESLERFIGAAMSSKKALIKSGDIGGAMYISLQDFETEALKLFYDKTVEPRKGFGLGSLDKLTKYKGFVRMGLGRGFHLNLLEYDAAADRFDVVAPLLK